MRIITYDDLSLEQKLYKPKSKKQKYIQYETWYETVKRCSSQVENKRLKAIDNIKNAKEKYNKYKTLILNSMGKDSIVTWDLVNSVIPNVLSGFNNTSLDCADTYKMVKDFNNCKIYNPQLYKGFYNFCNTYDFIPTRFNRACCDIFKENVLVSQLDKDDKYLFFMGMRKQESKNRSEYEYEWKNDKWGTSDWIGYLPVLEWSDLDIWLHILKYNLPINNKYKKGYTRVGCAIACPYYTKTTWALDKYWYPAMYNRWQNILTEDFKRNQRWTRTNATLKEYLTAWNGGLYRKEPTIEVIQEFADYKDINYDVAEKYFNKKCSCGKNASGYDVAAMNMKMHGRNVDKFMCKKCLLKEFSWTKEIWNERIKDFKEGGCKLF